MKSKAKLIVAALLIVVLTISMLSGCAQTSASVGASETPAAITKATGTASVDINSAVTTLEEAYAKVYDLASSGVVYIVTTTRVPGQGPLRQQQEQQSSGSGFVIDKEGNIITNYHVIDGADEIEVNFADDTSVTATVVGTDQGNDIALIKVDVAADSLRPLTLGDSAKLKVGQLVVAIGNPFGFERTMTTGIVSSLARGLASDSGRLINDLIQTDASINPGNSGGPLLNMNGDVVGITTAIESPVRGSVGVGFAVPINSAKSVLAELKGGQKVDHAWLGVSGIGLTPALAKQLELTVDSGAYVMEVTKGGPADKAGLKGAGQSATAQATGAVPLGGDVITAVDGRKVGGVDQIAIYIASKLPGDEVKLTVIRDKKEIQVNVTLGKWSDNPQGQQG